jgi:hypothetical protein
VTVLVPSAAPAAVPTASASIARPARGSLLSLDEAALLGHADQRADRVEHVHEQEEDDVGNHRRRQRVERGPS